MSRLTPVKSITTDTFGPYQEDDEVPIGGIHASKVLTNVHEIEALWLSMRFARRICHTPRALHISAVALTAYPCDPIQLQSFPTPLDPDQVTPDAAVVQSIRTWLTQKRVTVVARKMRAYACVDPKQHRDLPVVIFVNRKIIQAAGRSSKLYGTESRCFALHIMHMGVVLAHELQHGYRIHLSDRDTPPKVTSPRKDRYLHDDVDVNGKRIERSKTHPDNRYTEEAGWYFEWKMFGGEIARVLNIEDAELDEEEIDYLVVYSIETRHNKNFYSLNPKDVVMLVQATQAELDQLLPLKKPTRAMIQTVAPETLKRRVQNEGLADIQAYVPPGIYTSRERSENDFSSEEWEDRMKR